MNKEDYNKLIQIKDRLNASIVEQARISFEIDDLIKGAKLAGIVEPVALH